MSSTGSKSPEFKITSLTAGVGAFGVLIEMVRDGSTFSESVQIALLIAITLIGLSYNLSRGLAKYEHVTDGAAPSTGTSSEFKLTGALTGAGILPLLMEQIRGQETLSDRLTITLIGCITLTLIGYNLSRGLAKYEQRGQPPSSTSPGASPGA